MNFRVHTGFIKSVFGWNAGIVHVRSLLHVRSPQTSASPSTCFVCQSSLPSALVCQHTLSGRSPFAWAVVIGKPGVLLFQRPGSMEREVILGPWRRAWENGGGCRADKKQTPLRQEHVERHAQAPYLQHLSVKIHGIMKTGRCTQLLRYSLFVQQHSL